MGIWYIVAFGRTSPIRIGKKHVFHAFLSFRVLSILLFALKQWGNLAMWQRMQAGKVKNWQLPPWRLGVKTFSGACWRPSDCALQWEIGNVFSALLRFHIWFCSQTLIHTRFWKKLFLFASSLLRRRATDCQAPWWKVSNFRRLRNAMLCSWCRMIHQAAHWVVLECSKTTTLQ